MKSVEGKSAIVTGASAGIGYGIAKRFAINGVKVMIAGRTEASLQEAVSKISKEAPEATVCYEVLDATEEGAIKELVAAGEREFGSIDTFVANVGGNVAPSPVLNLDQNAWQAALKNNMLSGALATTHAARSMKASGGGSIILISSISGEYHDLWHAMYGAAKAGTNFFAVSAALELARFDIRVNVISPGLTLTKTLGADHFDSLREKRRLDTPTRRVADVDDISELALFLSSDSSSWITGQVIKSDGGLGIHVGSDFGDIAGMVHGEAVMREAGYRQDED